MSSAKIEAVKYSCDNPPCGITSVSDEGVPYGWFLGHALTGVGHYCSRDCIEQHFRASAMAEQRDTGGWIVGPLLRDPGMEDDPTVQHEPVVEGGY